MNDTAIISVETPTEAVSQPTKKNVGYRVLAGLLMLACVGLFFLPIGSFVKFWEVGSRSLFETVKATFASDLKVFGILPVLTEADSYLALATNIPVYALVGILVLCFILAFIAIFAAKKAPAIVRLVVLFLTWATAGYAICFTTLIIYHPELSLVIDLSLLAVIGVLVILHFVLSIIKAGCHVWMTSIHFLFDLVIFAAVLLAIVLVGLDVDKLYKLVFLAMLAAFALNLFISSCRIMSKRGLTGDLVRYIIQILVVLAAGSMKFLAGLDSKNYLFLVLIAAVFALLQIIVVAIQLGVRASKKRAKATAENEAIEPFAPAQEAAIAETEVAEAILATEATAPISALGNGFDPFLIQLNEEEKKDFLDLYILKNKGNMSAIPAYVVGGDNKDFFNKVFVYLGQYRDAIPNGLLYKMYQYSIKL